MDREENTRADAWDGDLEFLYDRNLSDQEEFDEAHRAVGFPIGGAAYKSDLAINQVIRRFRLEENPSFEMIVESVGYKEAFELLGVPRAIIAVLDDLVQEGLNETMALALQRFSKPQEGWGG